MSVPIDQLPQVPPASVEPPAQPAAPPAAKPALLQTLEQKVKDNAPEVYDYIQSLRKEAAGNRTLDAEVLAKENADLKASIRAKEEADLKATNDYKALYEREQTQRKEETKAAQKALIDARIEVLMRDEGINPKLGLMLIERRGVSVDEAGNVLGAGEAVRRLKEEWGEQLAVKRAAAGDPATPVTPATPAEDPRAQMLVPGSNITYAEAAKLAETWKKGGVANAGAAPTPNTPAAGNADKLPDFSKMPEKERKQKMDEWYANRKKSMKTT